MSGGKRELFLGLVISLLFSAGIMAQELEIIAVHFGNPEYAKALSQDDYPGFSFYTTDGASYRYREEQVLVMKNPNYLEGYYGEIPEKMGFSANYTTEKGTASPYIRGVIYLVGSNGVIYAQTSAGQKFNESNFSEIYYQDFELLKKAIKNLKKGKVATALKDKDRIYFKSTPFGEREPYKKSEVDKEGKGLVGWYVPEVTVYDAEGKAQQMNKLTEGKNCMLVFYTMDAVHYVEGSRKDGTILKEWDEIIPVNRAKEMKEATQNPNDPKAMLTSWAKTMGQTVSGTYEEFSSVLEFAKNLKTYYK
ncbi:MAG: hypothetical protein PHX07_00720 [Candidatus Marinimicrobia bacterium]|nr:hypothetical protein [Candidatus Neomarinimicrobiota bacterium]MDD3716897.1 hypothetical protein [Candidatus Neomarinimicrobiota bacterium]MDD4960741.1 hypothetical protein [Candidatus Neomarinimicrobiota bacterium]MDD5710369.1 hypothetical protein [Candidatus Neomarinimicrobiota bacterium]